MGGAPDRCRFPVKMQRLRPSDYEPKKSGGEENTENKPLKHLKNQGTCGKILIRDMYNKPLK